jgi:hypothetical protein
VIGVSVFYRRVRGKETAMGSLIEELSEELARAEEQASRLAIAREEVTRVLEEPAGAEVPAGPDGRPAWEYWRFHLAREHQRLYPGTKQGQSALGT